MREPPTTWQHVTRGPLSTDTERGDGLKFNLYKKTTRDFLVDMKFDHSLSVCTQSSEEIPEMVENGLRAGAQTEVNRQESKVHCLTVTVAKDGGQIGGKMGFDTLLNRKYSIVNTKKGAFTILALVKWYVVKLKRLTKMTQDKKKIIIGKMKSKLQTIREFEPFHPACATTCGIGGNKGCAREHHSIKMMCFPTATPPITWPLVGKGGVDSC